MDLHIPEFISQIISGTPTWAWVVLGYLLFIGIKSMRNHIVYLPKLFIVPAIFIGLKYKLFISHQYLEIACYFLCIGIGGFIGFLGGQKTPLKIFKSITSIELKGNYFTFFMLISLFCIKYVFGYLEDVQPLLYKEYVFLDLTLSGIFSGYLLGRSISYTYRFIQE